VWPATKKKTKIQGLILARSKMARAGSHQLACSFFSTTGARKGLVILIETAIKKNSSAMRATAKNTPAFEVD